MLEVQESNMIQGRICDQLTGTKVVLQRAGTKVVLWVCGLLPYYEYYAQRLVLLEAGAV